MRFFWCLLFISFNLYAQSTPPQQAIASAASQATEAGMKVLQRGGNAFDAAVVVSSVLSVVEPYNSGLGGGGFWLLYFADKDESLVIDSREVAPVEAKKALYTDYNDLYYGALAAAIPGEAAAMAYIASHYGKLPLDEVLEPAVHYADTGFKVGDFYRYSAKRHLSELKASPAGSMIFLDKGKVPELGYRVKQPELARVYRNMQYNGAEDFYHGLIARELVFGVSQAGGIWQLSDLENYRLKIIKPLVAHVFGLKITTMSDPSVGGIALIKMLKNVEDKHYFSKTAFKKKQLAIHAMEQAMAEKFQPKITVKVGENTTHFSILDKKGNRVAASLSLNFHFGSDFVVPGTGILLNNHMADFSLDDRGINQIVPGQRPLSSMSPTFVETDDGVLIIGTPGGPRIPTMVFLALLDFIENKDVKKIVAVPRFHYRNRFKKIEHEPTSFTQEELTKLKSAGYQFKVINKNYGDMQAIYWDKKKNTVTAASDPRREGKAILSN